QLAADPGRFESWQCQLVYSLLGGGSALRVSPWPRLAGRADARARHRLQNHARALRAVFSVETSLEDAGRLPGWPDVVSGSRARWVSRRRAQSHLAEQLDRTDGYTLRTPGHGHERTSQPVAAGSPGPSGDAQSLLPRRE